MNVTTLSSMEIELIYFLKNRSLYPKNRDELFESIVALDEDQYAVERILSHTNSIYLSLMDYYSRQKNDLLELILKNI